MGLLLLGLTGCAEEVPERSVIRPVLAAKVADVEGLTRRGFPGRAEAVQEIDLAFRVGGPLIARPVDVGSVVAEGDLVALIDPRDFEVELRNIRSQLAEGKARLELATSDYQRLRRIYEADPGATSEAAIDRARQQRDSTRAEVEALDASVTAAQDRLADTYLKAPFDGVVVSTFVENFQKVRPKQPVVRIIDKTHIEMVVNVPESLITMADKVKSVTLEFDTFPGRKFDGVISEIGAEASRTTRTFPVTLRIEQPDDVTILPGMAGSARVNKVDPSITRQDQGVVVPAGAVFTAPAETQSQVWVITPKEDGRGVLERRRVETGRLTRTGIIVTEGLSASEWVVTAGVHSVADGETVRILAQEGRQPE